MSRLSRRGFLQFSVAAAVASAAACSSDEPETSPDKRFPPGSFGASATAEAVTEGSKPEWQDGIGDRLQLRPRL